MNETSIYQYRFIKRPTEDEVNALGAAGWRLHDFKLDPRDGEMAYVVMELSETAAKIETKTVEANGRRK